MYPPTTQVGGRAQVGLQDIKRPKTTLCGHPNPGIRAAQNQSLAGGLEVRFLGRLAQRWCLHYVCPISSNGTSFLELLPVVPSLVQS
jgi:hypothetical protein